VIEIDIPEKNQRYSKDHNFNVIRLPPQEVIQRYDEYKKTDSFEKLFQGSLCKERIFPLSETILRCYKKSGRLACIFKFGKEIYTKNDFCNCFVEIDNSKSS